MRMKVLGLLLMLGILVPAISWSADRVDLDAGQAESKMIQGVYILSGGGAVARVEAKAYENKPLKNYGYVYFGWDLVVDIELVNDETNYQTTGYYILDSWGGIWPYGGATAFTNYPYLGWEIITDLDVLKYGINGAYVLDGWGSIHAIGNAPTASSLIQQGDELPYWYGWGQVEGQNPRGIAKELCVYYENKQVKGFYLLDGYGHVHEIGSVPSMQSSKAEYGVPYFGWDIARDIALTPQQDGLYLLDGFGSVFALGNAETTYIPNSYYGYRPGQNIEVVDDGQGNMVGLMTVGGGGILTMTDGISDQFNFKGFPFGADIARDFEIAYITAEAATAEM